MKLSGLEQTLLEYIDREYPVPWNKTEAENVVALGERPLPDRAVLAARFPKIEGADLDQALKQLIAYQCVATVYLYAKNEYSEFQTAPGIRMRAPSTRKGDGLEGYQVTPLGKEIVASFRWNAMKRLFASKFGEKAAEVLVGALFTIIGILLIMAISYWFGFDIKKVWNP